MDYILELFVTLSRWCRGNLSDIALAIMATLIVLLSPGINAWVQARIGGLNAVLRTLAFAILCAAGYGLALVYGPPWIVRGLSYFNNYALGPVLVLIFLIIGLLMERR